MAPIIKQLAKVPGIDTRVCVTGQHREMLDQVLALFDIKPHYDLDIMRAGQGLAYVTCAVLTRMHEVIADFAPDRIVVQGDTTTSFAAALAAFYDKVPVAHVEAGLRTPSIHAPWPEEMNRRVVTRLSDLHFAPTERARQNLLREGVDPAGIEVTGNTVIDALLQVVDRLSADRALSDSVAAQLPETGGRKVILATGHRRENFDGGLVRVCRALARLAERDDVFIVYPVHRNPHVREAVRLLDGVPNVRLVAPLDYLPFIQLMRQSFLIITDSGGIQEEAPSLGKPVLVTRETTERPEAVEAGTVELVGTATERIVERATRLLDDPESYRCMSFAHNPYGDGTASRRILERLIHG